MAGTVSDAKTTDVINDAAKQMNPVLNPGISRTGIVARAGSRQARPEVGLRKAVRMFESA